MASYNWPPKGGSGGVSSINNLGGAITLAGGSNVTITDNGVGTITISSANDFIQSITDTATVDLSVTASSLSATVIDGSISNTKLGALSVDNSKVSATAAIAYSKLALTGSIVNADVNASAAIAYSKLALAGSIVNADVATAAAIAVSKLAPITITRAVVSDASGFISPSTTTAAEIGFVSGVTSAIQTQLNAKQATGNYITALTGDVTAAGPGSVAGTIAANAVTNAKAAQMPTLTLKGNNTGGTANALDLSVAQVNAMLGSLSNPMNAAGQMIYGTTGGAPAVVAAGTAGQFVKSNGATVGFASFVAPTVQTFLSGSGTYNKPAAAIYIKMLIVGGAGGGGASGTTTITSGGNGASTTFGLHTAAGGNGGAPGGAPTAGGGTTAGAGLTPILAVAGGSGGGGYSTGASTVGGMGGSSSLGGNGAGGQAGASSTGGSSAAANSGSGGGGAGSGTAGGGSGGAGGAAGGTLEGFIYAPASTYSYSVGTGGAGGTASVGMGGGSGAPGMIQIIEYYQ